MVQKSWTTIWKPKTALKMGSGRTLLDCSISLTWEEVRVLLRVCLAMAKNEKEVNDCCMA